MLLYFDLIFSLLLLVLLVSSVVGELYLSISIELRTEHLLRILVDPLLHSEVNTVELVLVVALVVDLVQAPVLHVADVRLDAIHPQQLLVVHFLHFVLQ